MKRHIALFRGINVGGKNRLPMKDLSRILENLGYQNIKTYIQSGNVVFDSKQDLFENDLEKISETIFETFGFAPKVLVLDAERLLKAIRENPFPTEEGKSLHFFFLSAKPSSPDLKSLEDRKVKSERFHLTQSVLYLHAPNGIADSKLAISVERCLGVSASARNWNTVKKLQAMIQSA